MCISRVVRDMIIERSLVVQIVIDLSIKYQVVPVETQLTCVMSDWRYGKPPLHTKSSRSYLNLS